MHRGYDIIFLYSIILFIVYLLVSNTSNTIWTTITTQQIHSHRVCCLEERLDSVHLFLRGHFISVIQAELICVPS